MHLMRYGILASPNNDYVKRDLEVMHVKSML